MSPAAHLAPALSRSAAYRFLHLLLRPPAPGRRAELRKLSGEAPKAWGEELPSLLGPSDEEVMTESFRLLAPVGPVSLSAANHVDDGYADKGPILGDIAAFYRAFGFTPSLSEPPDHFACLFEFLSFAALKEAWALEQGDEEQARICREAEEELLGQHVHPYLSRFAEKLARAAPPGGFYASAARLVERFVSA